MNMAMKFTKWIQPVMKHGMKTNTMRTENSKVLQAGNCYKATLNLKLTHF